MFLMTPAEVYASLDCRTTTPFFGTDTVISRNRMCTWCMSVHLIHRTPEGLAGSIPSNRKVPIALTRCRISLSRNPRQDRRRDGRMYGTRLRGTLPLASRPPLYRGRIIPLTAYGRVPMAICATQGSNCASAKWLPVSSVDLQPARAGLRPLHQLSSRSLSMQVISLTDERSAEPVKWIATAYPSLSGGSFGTEVFSRSDCRGCPRRPCNGTEALSHMIYLCTPCALHCAAMCVWRGPMPRCRETSHPQPWSEYVVPVSAPY
ncbi:hypothetical protein C8Q78DRAFT_797413 [Trametes maxima]|nr:hypothetical protein C8Q78DRAFT_797413 [Trametes maxima]